MAIDINIPSQVKTYANLAAFPATGSLKTIFIAEDTNKTYRWTGTAYVEVSAAGATGITIGTTAITSGTVGRVLFEGTGNVVQESAGITWDNTNAVFSLGTLATKIINFKPADTASIFGNTSSIKGGVSGRIDFLNGSNLTHIYDGTVVVGPTAGPYIQVGSTSIAFAIGGTERARIAATTGNVLINTTTDAGFKLDVNGTARVSGLLTLSNGNYTTGAIGWGAQIGYYYDSVYGIVTNVGGVIASSVTSTRFNFDKSVGIGTWNMTNNASAVLQIDSTTKGFLCPRMTTTQKNAIASPAEGLQVWDTTLKLMSVYNGTAWITL